MEYSSKNALAIEEISTIEFHNEYVLASITFRISQCELKDPVYKNVYMV
jgi:hypothetical protein